MQAVVLRSTGGPEALTISEVPDPVPGAGEVLVRLRAAALNHRDVWIRKGQYAGITLPIITGSDGFGEVADVGPGADASWVKRRVVINPSLGWGDDPHVQGPDFRILGLPEDGTFAQFVKVPQTNVYAAPTDLTDEECAAIPLAGVTAYRALVTRAQVKKGETVVVTGIGGGVAVFALQMAVRLGARVFVTSGSEEKIARARQLGAEGGVNYQDPDWSKQLKRLTDGGPHAVIDSTGGEPFARLLELARPGARVVSYGATLGPVPELPMRHLFWKQLSVLGSTMGTDAEFAAMLGWFGKGALRPVVAHVFPLAQIAEAEQLMEARGQFGKIVLKIP